jgi:hypothetical protein
VELARGAADAHWQLFPTAAVDDDAGGNGGGGFTLRSLEHALGLCERALFERNGRRHRQISTSLTALKRFTDRLGPLFLKPTIGYYNIFDVFFIYIFLATFMGKNITIFHCFRSSPDVRTFPPSSKGIPSRSHFKRPYAIRYDSFYSIKNIIS